MMAARGKTIVLAAGGTGGHMFPALALAEELIGRGQHVLLFTDERGRAYADRLKGVAAHVVPSASPSRGGALGRVGFFATLARGAIVALRLLRRIRANMVVGFGGYASFPTALVAGRIGIPLVLHEQNAYLGLANRKLAALASAVAVAFPKVGGMPTTRAEITPVGNPVRPAFVALRERAYAASQVKDPFRLFVMGGSQGARIFSDVLPAAIDKLDLTLRARIEISQQCRPEDIEQATAAYARLGVSATLKSFFDDVPERIGMAHLVISRSGASTVAEITVAGRPAILVPYPHAADDHQRHNAEQVAASGAGWIMAQSEFTAEALAVRLVELAHRPHELAAAAEAARGFGRPNAAAALADLVERYLPQTQGAAA